MLCQCFVTVSNNASQQCFVSIFLKNCNHVIVTGYVLLGEIACNKYTLLLLSLLLFACRITLTLSCIMDLRRFPMDHQTCYVQIESCKCNRIASGNEHVSYPVSHTHMND